MLPPTIVLHIGIEIALYGTVHPLDGFALCGGGGQSHYLAGRYLFGLEPTTKIAIHPTPPIVESDQLFTGSDAFLTDWYDKGPFTAYAMGIKFQPSEKVSPPPPPPPVTCNNPVVIIDAKSPTRSQTPSQPGFAIDNNPATAWVSTNIANPFILLSLSEPKRVCRVDITWSNPDARYLFNIKTSLSTANFDYAFAGLGSGTETYTFPEVQARTVKITINESSPGSQTSTSQISDIKVFSNA